jgi:heme O synthase-like polyprenyltransferase
MPFTLAPIFTGLGGMGYAVIAALGGAFFLFLAWRGYSSAQESGGSYTDCFSIGAIDRAVTNTVRSCRAIIPGSSR